MRASKAETQKWFAVLLASGLDLELMTSDDVLGELTPEVLAQHLPAEQVSAVLAASLEEGAMTSDLILYTIGPKALCRHVPLASVWKSVSDGPVVHHAGGHTLEPLFTCEVDHVVGGRQQPARERVAAVDRRGRREHVEP